VRLRALARIRPLRNIVFHKLVKFYEIIQNAHLKSSLISYNFGMKFFIAILLILLLTSCSHKNAFTEFKMDENQELSIASLKRTKIIENAEVIGAFNAIYLNEVYPDVYNGDEYFFVYIYLKKIKLISNPNTKNNNKLSIYLNNNSPIKLKELKSDNRFYKLSGSKNKWSKYYLVSFVNAGKALTLKLENDHSFSASLNYLKDQQ